jgi:hypothetical protein
MYHSITLSARPSKGSEVGHPIGRKAMTPAERLARRRARLQEAARQQLLGERQAAGIGTCQPPKGYGAAAKLQAQGHVFERARSEAGFEEG